MCDVHVLGEYLVAEEQYLIFVNRSGCHTYRTLFARTSVVVGRNKFSINWMYGDQDVCDNKRLINEFRGTSSKILRFLRGRV
jgi:hypothetical protein